MSLKFKCKRCGWCCKTKNISIVYSDIARWTREARYDILKEVSYVKDKDNRNIGFYFSRTLGKNHGPCPFLSMNNGLASCIINDTKPKACRYNPEIIPRESYRNWLGCPGFMEVHKEWIERKL